MGLIQREGEGNFSVGEMGDEPKFPNFYSIKKKISTNQPTSQWRRRYTVRLYTYIYVCLIFAHRYFFENAQILIFFPYFRFWGLN